MTPSPFQAVQVSERVFWVGAIDWSLRDFHGYLTSRGTSYNAYLVIADKITLVDTVKRPFLDEMLARIRSVVDPAKIDYVVSHHAEMDHSGCLPEILRLAPYAKVLTSKAGWSVLGAHFEIDAPVEIVGTGSEVDLGGAKLTFHETRMIHWPESMFSFLQGDQVLFSQDAFGMHLASHERFTDRLPAEIVQWESAKYFANILMPFSDLLGRHLARAHEAKVLASDHGPIWRKNIDGILGQYETWAARRPRRKLVIAYDTMWQSTAAMTRAIAEGAADLGVDVVPMKLGDAHRSDVATELLDAAGLLIGTPNLNGQMFPTVADLLTYLKGLKPKGLLGGTFGSFGWSPAVGDQVQSVLKELKVDLVGDPLLMKFVPRGEDLLTCRRYGEQVARRILDAVPA